MSPSIFFGVNNVIIFIDPILETCLNLIVKLIPATLQQLSRSMIE